MVNYLLDTCVISELSKSDSSSPALEYLGRLDSKTFHLSVVTIGEIQKGCSLLPSGRRRTSLEGWLNSLEATFLQRVLPFDQTSAHIWGEIVAKTHQMGFNLSVPDTMIAATAIQHGMHVVTRNVKDFEPTGVLIVNPWEADV
jgi:predicted nucleic acid-binding protein